MAKKSIKEEADEDIENELDEVAIKSVAGRVGGGKKIVSEALAKALYQKIEKDGVIAVPKEWLERKIGMDTNKAMKGRPNSLKIKLNMQHGDLIGDGRIWHVGDLESGKFYRISINEVNADEENKWKNWKPSKKRTTKTETKTEEA